MTNATPAVRPLVPHFSSGPCPQRPAWTPQGLNGAVLGRSHRSKAGKAKLKRAIMPRRKNWPKSFITSLIPQSLDRALVWSRWVLVWSLGMRGV